MFLLFIFAFLSGLVTILAPCIWPLLPIILSSAAAGKGHRRPLGIVLGIILSFGVFTLSLSSLVRIFHFDPNALRFFAVVVLGVLGLSMLIPALAQYLEMGVSRLSSLWGWRGQTAGSGFWAGFLTGLTLGIVWAPCAGPILAAIATLAAMGHVTWQVVIITSAYALGVGVPLFFFAYGGQKIFASARSVSPYTPRIQQIFGVIMILAALAIYTNYDKQIELDLLNRFPALSNSVSQFEDNATVRNALAQLKNDASGKPTTTAIPNYAQSVDLFNADSPAPEFAGITHWLNTDQPLTISGLRGRVVLVDFWTYTCINCLRTLPHVTAWYDKYKDQGLVVVGVHAPEFEFEKDTTNVADAIAQYKIHYPVAQDNAYGTWNAYENQYWPAEYLIDANGIIRRTHFGEGEYDKMEEAIQALLAESGKAVTTTLSSMPDQTPTGNISPETYVGASRAQFYYPTGGLTIGPQKFLLESNLPTDSFSLGGEWNIAPTQAVAGSNATLVYHFNAGKVFLVLRPGSSNVGSVRVFLDGARISAENSGADVIQGIVTVDKDRLYNLVDLHGKTEDHILKLEFATPGVEVYAFTFGQ